MVEDIKTGLDHIQVVIVVGSPKIQSDGCIGFLIGLDCILVNKY